MSRVIAKDATDQSVTLVILTTSGTPKTDVVHNTADLALWYRREGGAKVPITPAALATPTVDDPHIDGGFIHVGDGVYRLDLPDAAVASGADHVTIGGSVPDGVILSVEVQLVTIDLQAANLPANVTQWKGVAPADLTDTDKVQVSVQHTASSLTFNLTGNITGNVSGSVGSVTGNVGGNVIGSVGSISGVTFPANFGALGINSSGHILRVTLVDTTTTNTDMRGTDNASTLDAAGIRAAIGLASANLDTQLGTIDGVVDAIKVVTDKLDTTLESDGDGGHQFTETALENAPAGGGGLTPEQATQLSETHTRVTTALPDAAPSSEEGLPVTGDLITSDDLETADDFWAKLASGMTAAGSVGKLIVDTSAKFSGITSLAHWLRGMIRKDTMDATAKAEINESDGSYDEATDSLQAIRDRGDAAWATGSGAGDASLAKQEEILAAIRAKSPLPVNSPASAGKILETVRGDDHTVDSPHGPYIWAAPASVWGNLNDAVIKFTSRRVSDDVAEIDGYTAGFTVLNANTEDQAVQLELPASETIKLTPGANGATLTNKFDVQVKREDGVEFTLARGTPPFGGHTIYEDQTRST